MNMTKPVLFVLALGLFAACGGHDKSSGTPAKLTLRFEAVATTLNPYQNSAGYSRYVSRQIFQELGVMNPESLTIEPLIIKELPLTRVITDGPRKGQFAYDIEILPEAAWADGSAVTGHDFVFTLKIIFHPLLNGAIYRSYFSDMNGIDVDASNPKKFTVYFNKLYALSNESICQIPILPSYQYDPGKWLEKVSLVDLVDPEKAAALATSNPNLKAFADNFNNPKYDNDPASIMGSGAYLPVQFNAGQNVILVKKSNWWGNALTESRPLLAAYPDTIEYRFIKDETALENYLYTGDIDLAGNISAAKYEAWKSDKQLSANYNFFSRPSTVYNRWMFNTTNPKLADKKVRRALAMMVDYNYIIKTIQLGQARQIVSPVFVAPKYYDNTMPIMPFQIDSAKTLLAEAGWKDTNGDGTLDKVLNGKRTELTIDLLATTSSKSNEMLAISLAETCKLAGVTIKITPVDITTLSPRTKSGDFESAIVAAALFPGFYDFNQQFHSTSLAPVGDNRSRMSNPEADKVFDALRNATTETDLKRYFLEAQRIYRDEMPEVPLYAADLRFVVAKKFEPVLSTNRPGYYEHLFKLK